MSSTTRGPYRSARWKRTMRERRHFGISRIDSGATHCWLVRLGYAPRRPRVVRTFSDGVYGGKRRAEAEAIAFRNKKLARQS
jgi:hypothetical protein